jgi:hypothetical protein
MWLLMGKITVCECPLMIIVMGHGKDKKTDDADGDIRTSEN